MQESSTSEFVSDEPPSSHLTESLVVIVSRPVIVVLPCVGNEGGIEIGGQLALLLAGRLPFFDVRSHFGRLS